MRPIIRFGLALLVIALVGLAWSVGGAPEAAVVPPHTLIPAFPTSGVVRSANPEFSQTFKPTITDVRLKYSKDGDFIGLEVLGTNLGSSRGTKFLYIDGIQADVNEMVAWSDTKIDVDRDVFWEISKDIIWWVHTYKWFIVEGGTPISNAFLKRFPIHLHRVTPASASRNTPFEIRGDGLDQPGSLMIGTHLVPPGHKESHRIQAVVPETISPGTYQLSIVRSGVTVSDTIPFTIL